MSDLHPGRIYAEQAPRAPEGPFSLHAVAGGEGPLELDIGFGRGRSLLDRAEVAPDSRIIGIEVKTKWACRVRERLRKHGVSNVQVLCGDAREILNRAGPDGIVDKVAVHFPDPWWKKRHQKRRMVDESLLVELRRLMRPGGKLFIQTDVEDRAELYLRQIRAIDGFGRTSFVDENPFLARSNREIRAVEAGLPVWRILAIRDGG